MNSVGWVVWSCVLSLVWLLPNHYMPWLSFHADLLCAVVLTIATLPLIQNSFRKSHCGILSLLSGLAALVIGIQYAFGQIHQMGTAWIGIAYLTGFIWAIQTGKYWQINRNGLAADAIFLAIGIASIVSVGLQLQQWFVLDGLFLWTMGGDSLRPHANLGQANQLGTLLLWGLLAGAWGVVRGYIRTNIAGLTGAFLLFGIGLTGSRIAWLNVGVLIGVVWFCRSWWGKGKAHWVVTGLGVYFLACVVFQGLIQHWDQGGLAMVGMNENFNRPSGSIRIAAWSAFADAALRRPWPAHPNRFRYAVTEIAHHHR